MLFFSFLWVDKQITNVVHRHSISSTSAIAERAFDWLASLHGCPAPFNSVCVWSSTSCHAGALPHRAVLRSSWRRLLPTVYCYCTKWGSIISWAVQSEPVSCSQVQPESGKCVCVCVWLHWLICVRLCAFHGHRRCIACIGLYACLMWTCTCP